MTTAARRTLFLLFFLSGHASLVYQVVWTRMAFASFGIITPVLSVVLSVFMLGLATGSWLGGKYIRSLTQSTGRSAILFYGAAELLIGLGAFIVPRLFAGGQHLLLAAGETDSLRYLALSALVLAFAILPWCLFMGTTFPFMMAFLREQDTPRAESFSFLYLANVLGAMCGTFLTAVVWVELLGFRHTLWLAAAGNFIIVAISIWLGRSRPAVAAPAVKVTLPPVVPVETTISGGSLARWLLFSTGFVAMAMEVVWTRAFSPVLKTQVYAFALVVFTYLGATFAGSWLYRRHLAVGHRWSTGTLLGGLALASLLPVLANDTRFVTTDWLQGTFEVPSALLLMVSICPFCGLLGYLTPSLIDQGSGGDPDRAGRLYALNVLGCILGPLFACYVLLPNFSERCDLIILSLPILAFQFGVTRSGAARQRLGWSAAAVGALLLALFVTCDFETMLRRTYPRVEVRRDYAASVISFGDGMDRNLLVNGVGMTKLTPLAKLMVHLPLVFHHGPSQSALVICFGMGTSFRSALSWGLDTTVVELVPGVTGAFGYYHADAAEVLKNPRAHVVIDDGRRFLQRTTNKFDVIIVDPPPPVEAAGSSLLFSGEFYAVARQHLNPGGILQMWYPGGEFLTTQAAVRSAVASFPYVLCFGSMARSGLHILASEQPFGPIDIPQLTARLPESARRDLLEWYANSGASNFLPQTIANETPLSRILNADTNIAVTDDLPYNEYFLLRKLHP